MFNDSSSYSEFKSEFYKRIDDFTLFDLDLDINLTKVVLSGLRVNYINRGKYRAFFFYPKVVLALFLFLKKLTTKKIFLDSSKKEFVFFEGDRFINKGQEKSVAKYSNKIINYIGREKSLIISNKTFSQNLFDYDYSFQEIKNSLSIQCKISTSSDILQKLKSCYLRIADSGIFNFVELANIKIAFHEFFLQYITTKFLLESNLGIKKAFIVCHYHNEGKIAALKAAGLEIIELQHGLIAESDIFYCFPKKINSYVKQMLFPNKIWVWGSYWKDVLLSGSEFNNEQIKVVGYFVENELYTGYDKRLITEFYGSSKKKVLVSTQISLHNYFIEYVLWLSNREPNTRIIVKIHPAESIEVYNRILKVPNILVLNYNLYLLFEEANIHISAYSTTLIESLPYNLVNYSLNIDVCEDYIDEFTRKGISRRLPINQVPELTHTQKERNKFKDFFVNFQMNENLIYY
ncbi:MAG: hypothetical protein ACXITV_00110 [Luteibaculaceae bacterium]